MSSTIVWFRQDLRISDNPALVAALALGHPIIPVFILDTESEGRWAPGGASRWWLDQSLEALDRSLRKRGNRLLLRRGSSLNVLSSLVEETSATAVFWNRRYEPTVVARDTTIKESLVKKGVTVESFNASLLFEPWQLKTQAGKPYQVFTPFWNSCRSLPPPPGPMPAPNQIPAPSKALPSDDLRSWTLRPTIPWDAGFAKAWAPGEAGALKTLERFLDDAVVHYPEGRDRPDQEGTSRLSPYLHFGELSPRTVWHAAQRRMATSRHSGLISGGESYLREMAWREFAYHLLFHFPETPEHPLRPAFEKFPWKTSSVRLKAWQKGRTGYPLVDAGMRQLWTTGWMHNRVRMIVGSFLVKNLLLPWTAGANWFWDTLVDADLANNTLGWQWISGCGADAAPYFRIFNPVSQGERFDPNGDYVRRWVPELSTLPSEWIHKPFDAPSDVLAQAGVTLGKNYPPPIVDLGESRQEALAALATLKGDRQLAKKPKQSTKIRT